MKTGISTFSLDDPLFLIQLDSLLEQDIKPDFILLHNAGALNRLRKYLRLFSKLIRQERAGSLRYLRNLKAKHISIAGTNKANQISEKASVFLKSTRILHAGGINEANTIRLIRQQAPALIVCNSGILREEVLQCPDIVFLNVHASRLPAYRGMNNVEWALLEEQQIYATIHRIAREIDEGDILFQEKLELGKLSSIAEYRNAAFAKSHALLGKAIKEYLHGLINFIAQSDKGKPLFQYYSMHPLLKECLERKLKTARTNIRNE